MSNVNNEGVLNYLATVGNVSSSGGSARSSSSGNAHSWLEAFARAWGAQMDGQAMRITELSDSIGASGNNMPSEIVQLTAASQQFGLLAQNAATSQNSLAEGLGSIAKRQ